MPRLPRLEFEGAFHHVFNRGDRKKRLFFSNEDYQEFERLLLDLAERMSINLYAWCLMPNHFHFLIETPLANLSTFMQRLLSNYAQYFNRVHREVGHVFQGRFQAILCDQEAYLRELVRYIHLNPYRVKYRCIVPEGGWPWSSHRYYMQGHEPAVVRPFIHAVLRRFGDDPENARDRYEQFVADGLAKNQWEKFYQPKGNRYLGGERFIEESKLKAGEPTRQEERRIIIQLPDLAKEVARQMGIRAEDMLLSTKQRPMVQARKTFVYIARRYGHLSPGAIGRYLNVPGPVISYLFRSAETAGETPVLQAVLSSFTEKKAEAAAGNLKFEA